MGLGSFIKSNAGGFGSLLGSAAGGPLGGVVGGMLGGGMQQQYQQEQQFGRDKYWFAAQEAQAKEFAQNNIQWKVDDANKAGIHPLAALGVQPQSAPASMIGSNLMPQGDSMGQMGQDIGRAIMANKTPHGS